MRSLGRGVGLTESEGVGGTFIIICLKKNFLERKFVSLYVGTNHFNVTSGRGGGFGVARGENKSKSRRSHRVGRQSRVYPFSPFGPSSLFFLNIKYS